MTDKKSGAPDGDGGGGISDQGFDRWLNRQLHRLYDPVLSEDVPDEIMRPRDVWPDKDEYDRLASALAERFIANFGKKFATHAPELAQYGPQLNENDTSN